MQVTVEESDKLERKLRVQVPADEVEQAVTERLRKVGRTARIKGFRPGKIPFKVVAKHYGPQIRREVVGDLMQSTFVKAVQDQKLNPAGGPQFEPGDLGQGKDLEYTATFEVYPQVALDKISGLQATRRVAEVSESDINDMLEKLRKQRAEWIEADRAAATGDQVVIDFIGRIDGEAFAGGASQDYPVTLGAGSLLKDLEDGLLGMSAGDTRTVPVAFPEDYHAKEMAGKTADFDVTVKTVQEQSLPEIDAEFVKAFGEESGDIAAFRDAIRANMEREAAERSQTEIRGQILKALVDANPVDVPNVLLEREIEQLQRDSRRQYGGNDDMPLPREPFVEQARQRVALGLLIGEIVTSKDLKAPRDKLDEKIAEIAAGQPDAAAAVGQIRSDQNFMHQIEMMVLEAQVVELLIDDGDIKTEAVDFAQLMAIE